MPLLKYISKDFKGSGYSALDEESRENFQNLQNAILKNKESIEYREDLLPSLININQILEAGEYFETFDQIHTALTSIWLLLEETSVNVQILNFLI